MDKSLLQQHRDDLDHFIQNLRTGQLAQTHALYDEILTVLDMLKKHLPDATGVEQVYGKHKHRSYLNAFREYLEEGPPKLFYRDALYAIEAMTEARFSQQYPNYSAAVRAYLRNKTKEPVETAAEFRAYFENRFYNPLDRFFKTILPDCKLTLNLVMWSFLGKQMLPNYRMNVNLVKDREEDLKLYKRRGANFNALNELRKEYTSAWDIVRNNITTIFYFDKVETSPQMTVYEIDPDVTAGIGRGKVRYSGRSTFSTKHRVEKDDIKVINPEALSRNPKDIFKKFEEMRKRNPVEREYQYKTLRFFIRTGIFNPLDAPYAAQPGEPSFIDLLRAAPPELRSIVEDQYKSSTGRIAPPKEGESDKAFRIRVEKAAHRQEAFRHSEKYSTAENIELDKVLSYIDDNDSEFINVRIALLEAGFFFLTKDKNSKISDIYWLPVLLNWREQHVGGVTYINSDRRIVITRDEKGAVEDREPGQSIEKGHPVSQKIISTLYYLTGLFGDKQIGEIEESVRPVQERAAAVSIMSRNISHNLGSHVLSYLRNRLSDEGLMLREGILQNIIKRQVDGDGWEINKSLLKEPGKCVINESEFVAPYMRSVGQLLGYLQERQDYIGTLASDWYVYYGPVNFKREVADFFSERLPIKSGTNYTTHNLILDFITHSEGYDYDDIQIDWLWKDPVSQKTVKIPYTKSVALPSGISGRQGIYTILENFMRNSAKHGSHKKDRPEGKLYISFTLSEFGNPDYYKVELRDNSRNADEKIKKTIEDVLKLSLVRPDGSTDERHKGIKEIQIAAGALRGITPPELLDPYMHDGLPILQASIDKGELCYSFYLRKPKPALLIVKDASQYLDTKGQLLPKFEHLTDWEIKSYQGNPNTINEKKAHFEFVLIHEAFGDNGEFYREIYARNPVRILTNIKDSDLLENRETLSEWLYATWMDGTAKTSKKGTPQPRFALAFGDLAHERNSNWPIGIEDDTQPEVLGEAKQYIITDVEKARSLRVLFRRHNDTPSMFNDFRQNTVDKKQYNKYVFIEGITGNNSTARLLRDEEKTRFWHLKMLESALTKILILDERVWKNLQNEAVGGAETQYELLRKKNIYVLNLEKQDKRLVLIDLLNREIASVDEHGNISFSSPENENLYSSFHFISLHQGLLDRVMKHTERTLRLEGKDLADDLFRKFKEKFWAMFRCIIHSGRSKTPTMPKHSAFVQFSSLDTALRDCKFTLCELFYSTIEEVERP